MLDASVFKPSTDRSISRGRDARWAEGRECLSGNHRITQDGAASRGNTLRG